MPRPLIDERRSRILAAARELTLERGWTDTTVAAIAERAGVGKGAVYLEFADKQAVLAAMLVAGYHGLVSEVRRRVEESRDTVTLAAVYRFGVEALLGDPLLLAVQTGGGALLGDHIRSVRDDRYLARVGWLDDYIQELQDAGVLDASEPTDRVALMLSVFTLGLAHAPGVLGELTADDLAATVDLFARVVERGLAAAGDVDAAAARGAQLRLLERLDAQLEGAT